MELEKIEIKGFKSFGEKTIINFDKGTTGIVGPNGCGKSNIVDAIRWVLGEQKIKALRSEKMENIIFNGTKKRKPLQMAEVSLTFNNTKNILPTEYSTVTITRRYYRSGDGEYELNGVKCRLKDITNLFLDTGITPDSYSIIELGMVDDILNDKDNSRRTLFEEAAGISKFKKRKKETLRRLEDTDVDLERVDDLLFEIDKNMKDLQKQARQAERYYKLKEEYKEKSVILAKLRLGGNNDSLQKVKKQVDGENDRKASLTRQIAEKEAHLEKAKTDQVLKEKELSASQKRLNDHVNSIRQYESDKQIKNERLRFLNDKTENLKEQVSQDRKSLERARFSITSLETEKNEAEKSLKDTRNQLGELLEIRETQASKTHKLQEEVNALNEAQISKREQVFQLRKSLEIKEVQITSLKHELERASSDTTEQSESLKVFEEKSSELEKLLSEKNRKLEQLRNAESNLRTQIESTGKTIDVIRDEQLQLSRKLDARQNEFNLTKSLVDNLEGFPEAIKFLKKESDWGKNAPLLSDIISCGDEYKVTVENYLESYMNYYVVQKESDAYKAVNILSDASKGRAHFFILDKFEDFTPSTVKIYDRAFPASEVVEYDKKYSKLIAYIFNNVYILEGNENGNIKDDDVIFITRNGKFTKTRFSISGGSVGLFEGKKLGRAKNLVKLEKEIGKLQGQLEKVDGSLKQSLEEIEGLKRSSKEHEIEALQLEISHLSEEYVSISTKHEQFAQMLSNVDLKKEDIHDQSRELEQLVNDSKPEISREEKELSKIEEKLQVLQHDLDLHSSLYNEKNSAYNNENIILHKREAKVVSLKQEIQYKKNTLASTDERISRSSEDLNRTDDEIKTLIETTSSSDDDLVKMYEEKEKLEKAVNKAEKVYYQVRGDIDETQKQEREIQQQRENVDALLMELHSKLSEIKIELTGVKERLSAEFGIDVKDISSGEIPEDVDSGELMERVEKIRTRLENMGPVNPMAMEAYGEIQERHEFISVQKEDLIKAKESLRTTIEEIDMVARETFMKAFEHIKTNFIKVFRSLFSEEDDCDLRLSDTEDPLESTVEIIAKPKGKKPLTINQLSGGEKTLTATALLFAIYLLKPAPFCIFDEVDAPLDDANIDKFNQIIELFAKDSQFIIVTHNKRTMIHTDVIYGITMAEQGISKVVPVDLRQLA